MKIIFSRKGFDSSSGGKPSPILPDGRMISLPIPDKNDKKGSKIQYQEIHWREYDLGKIVSDLTSGRILPTCAAHLDPDINKKSLKRHRKWMPMFGQTGASQGHLRKNNIQSGDIFLFFGLYQNVVQTSGMFKWDNSTPKRHVLWGWLQIEKIVKIDECNLLDYKWAEYHPHFNRPTDKNNTLYIASRHLKLPGYYSESLTGAGVFPVFSEKLVLTAPDANTHSEWELPRWFWPRDDKYPLTYHKNPIRWGKTVNGTRLNTVARGQEFILDTVDYPEAIEWLMKLLKAP